MDSDFSGDEEGHHMTHATTKTVSSKLYKDGYRHGKQSEESRLVQAGFDDGMKVGLLLGRICGSLYAACRHEQSIANSEESSTILKSIEAILFDKSTLHENIAKSSMERSRLEELVRRLSGNLNGSLAEFISKLELLSLK